MREEGWKEGRKKGGRARRIEGRGVGDKLDAGKMKGKQTEGNERSREERRGDSRGLTEGGREAKWSKLRPRGGEAGRERGARWIDESGREGERSAFEEGREEGGKRRGCGGWVA